MENTKLYRHIHLFIFSTWAEHRHAITTVMTYITVEEQSLAHEWSYCGITTGAGMIASEVLLHPEETAGGIRDKTVDVSDEQTNLSHSSDY